MASSINTSGIDETKPEEGLATTLSVRDNFAAIKAQLGIAGTEITAAQLLLAALEANKQPLDATLTSIAAQGTAADKLLYTTDVDTWTEAALTAAGRALLAAASAGDQLTVLGVSAFVKTLLDDADAAAARGTLGVDAAAVSGTYAPVLAFAGLSTGITYGVQSGHYTDFNGIRLAWGRLGLTSKGTATGAATISLPGAAASGAGNPSVSIGILRPRLLSGTISGFDCAVASGTSTLSLLKNIGTTSAGVIISDTDFTNSTDIVFAIVHRI